MRRYWSQAAMLLLGVSLSVGFYEGRRLVKNTAKALTAATSITASASRRGRDRDRAEEEDPDAEVGLAGEEDPPERKRKRSRSTAALGVEGGGELSRTDKLNALRQRQRHRFSPSSRTATVPGLATPYEPAAKDVAAEPPPIDTAAELPQPQ